MSKQKKPYERFQSVSEMLRETGADPELTQAVEAKIRSQSVITCLVSLRASRGLSQADIARTMDCSQSKISKLEGGCDADLKLGDLGSYIDALGMELSMLVHPKGQKLTSRVKFHAMAIKRDLRKLVGLTKLDESIIVAARGFINESFFNLVKIASDSMKSLPPLDESNMSIEVVETKNGEEDEAIVCQQEPNREAVLA